MKLRSDVDGSIYVVLKFLSNERNVKPCPIAKDLRTAPTLYSGDREPDFNTLTLRSGPIEHSEHICRGPYFGHKLDLLPGFRDRRPLFEYSDHIDGQAF